jgi:hypothetical protein
VAAFQEFHSSDCWMSSPIELHVQTILGSATPTKQGKALQEYKRKSSDLRESPEGPLIWVGTPRLETPSLTAIAVTLLAFRVLCLVMLRSIGVQAAIEWSKHDTGISDRQAVHSTRAALWTRGIPSRPTSFLSSPFSTSQAPTEAWEWDTKLRSSIVRFHE